MGTVQSELASAVWSISKEKRANVQRSDSKARK